MQFKIPRDDPKYRWTNHVIRKMMHYGLSPDRVKRVIRAPNRMEVGIAENTLAAMQVAGSKKNPSEIWVMWAERGKKPSKADPLATVQKVIITAWRYPGISPVRDEIPIPANILAELKREKLI
jgi:hypothetical protein